MAALFSSLKSRSATCHFLPAHAVLISLCIATTGCAKVDYSNRTFFRDEYGLDTHGRKAWIDHLVEIDPGGIDVNIAPDYKDVAPLRIAVLPFSDRGSAQYVINKIPLTRRGGEEQANWAWTDANRLRRAVQGFLSQREFLVANLLQVDQAMKQRGVRTENDLVRVAPETLGRWLGVDAVVYGELTHYEAYYAVLVSAWQVGVKVRMVSAHDGRELFSADGNRYSVDLRPALSPMDVAINSGLSLLELRDVTLARAEEENAREIVLRIPRSTRLENELIEQVRSVPASQTQGFTLELSRER
jgi:putative lipoprotein DUF799